MPITDMTNPPMVPAANENQKLSFSPIINGRNPNTVEVTVRNIGITFTFHALTYAAVFRCRG